MIRQQPLVVFIRSSLCSLLSSQRICLYPSVFVILVLVSGSVRQIKLAVRQLLGARKYRSILDYGIVFALHTVTQKMFLQF